MEIILKTDWSDFYVMMQSVLDSIVSHFVDTDVLIIGGSLTGLTMALACQRQGIGFILVEKHPRSSVYPRAKTLNARAMEVFRALGVEAEVRAAGATLQDRAGRISGPSLMEALEVGPKSKDSAPSPGAADALTPAPLAVAPQNRVDPTLKAIAEARGGDLRFGLEAVALEQSPDAVTTTLIDRETGEKQTLRSRYVVAADGVGGKTRESLDIEREDFGVAGHYLNILFEADLRRVVAGREFNVAVLKGSHFSALVHTLDDGMRWTMQLAVEASLTDAGPVPLEKYDQIVGEIIGVPALEIKILNALPWQAASGVARTFRRGRVFLAGDAAHQMTPYMANGASSGIQDALNLAWKLGMVLQRTADRALLDTYEAERLPVTRQAVITSSKAADERGMPSFDPSSPDLDPWLLLGLNYSYQSAAIIGGGEFNPADEGQPGRRVPHAWLRQSDGSRLSTLDLVAGRFVLLTGPDGTRWAEALDALALPMPVETFVIGDAGLVDESGVWAKRAGVGPDGALLIRPDGFIAWRALDSTENFQSVLGQLLGSFIVRSD